MEVTTKIQAWKKIKSIFPTDYVKDETKTKICGYPVYVSTETNCNDYISDFGDRLEVKYSTGKAISIWIVPQKPTETETEQRPTETKQPTETEYHELVGKVNVLATMYYIMGEDKKEEFDRAVLQLCKKILLSVYNKIYSKSANPHIRKYAIQAIDSMNYLDALTNCSNDSTKLQYNKNGDIEVVISDKVKYDKLAKLMTQTLSDGYSLISCVYIALMEEIKDQTNRDMNICLFAPYSVERLKKRVRIKEETSSNIEVAETSPIKEVYRAVRREIDSLSAIQIQNGKYCYLEDIITWEDNDGNCMQEIGYRRLQKYSQLADLETDINGKDTFINASVETVETVETMIKAMNLTEREQIILDKRLSGYGYKAIATYLGTTRANIQRCVKRIAEKAIASGINPFITK